MQKQCSTCGGRRQLSVEVWITQVVNDPNVHVEVETVHLELGGSALVELSVILRGKLIG